MSLRDKAREVRARGEAERGDFTPKGAPLKIYQYWLGLTEHAPERENFCHFWRVVAIWAPLMWLRQTFLPIIDTKAFGIAVLTAFVAVLVWACFVFSTVWQAVAVFLIVLALIGLLIGVGHLVYRFWPRKWNPKIAHAIDVSFPYFVGVVLMTPVVVGIIFGNPWWGVLVIYGINIGLFALIFSAACWFEAVVLSKRSQRREAEREYRYDYLYKHGEFPSETESKPGLLQRFCTGLADLLVFAFQVVRVNKWKICPTVEIDALDETPM